MTEQLEQHEQQPSVPPQEQEQPQSPEDIAKLIEIKAQMSEQASALYHQFGKYVRQLPINAGMKARALAHFDDGILWVHEALRVAKLKLKPIPQPEPVNPAPVENPVTPNV